MGHAFCNINVKIVALQVVDIVMFLFRSAWAWNSDFLIKIVKSLVICQAVSTKVAKI